MRTLLRVYRVLPRKRNLKIICNTCTCFNTLAVLHESVKATQSASLNYIDVLMLSIFYAMFRGLKSGVLYIMEK